MPNIKGSIQYPSKVPPKRTPLTPTSPMDDVYNQVAGEVRKTLTITPPTPQVPTNQAIAQPTQSSPAPQIQPKPERAQAVTNNMQPTVAQTATPQPAPNPQVQPAINQNTRQPNIPRRQLPKAPSKTPKQPMYVFNFAGGAPFQMGGQSQEQQPQQ